MHAQILVRSFVAMASAVVVLSAAVGALGLERSAPGGALPQSANASSAALCVTPSGGGPYSGCAQVFTNVQAAVDFATGGETIKVAAGIYTDIHGRPSPAGYSGPTVITQVVYISKTVTIQGGYTTTDWSVPFPLTQSTTLNAQGQGRVLFITGNISPVIEGLRITGGDATWQGGLGGTNDGGGVYVDGSTVTLNTNIIISNTAFNDSRGGGLYLAYSTATLRGNTLAANHAFQGGGLYTYQSWVTLNDNIIDANDALEGGGIRLWYSAATLNGNTISANSADYSGGGLYRDSGSAALHGNLISANTAGESGGGVYLYGTVDTLIGNAIFSNTAQGSGGGVYIQSSGEWRSVLSDNSIVANAAGTGGGIYLDRNPATLDGNAITSNTATYDGAGLSLRYSDATLTNNIIAENQAGQTGSGLYVVGGRPLLLHTTLARNRGGDGSGIYVYSGDVSLANTILVSHTVGITVTAGNTATLESSLWGTGDWANTSDWGGSGTIITGTHNFWDDPAFVNPDVKDYHLNANSAAIGAGVNAGVLVDIDHQPRPANRIDIGADEYWAPGALKYVYLPLMVKNY